MTRIAAVASLFFLAPLWVPSRLESQVPHADAAGEYRFDLSRYYFASPEVEVTERAQLRRRATALRSAAERMTTSAPALLRTLRLADSVRTESKRHSIYLYLRTQLNTLDGASAQARSMLDAELDAATSFVDNGLLSLDDGRFAAWTQALPALGTYRHEYESVRSRRKHTLTAEQEGIISTLAPMADDWPVALYHRLIARTDFSTLQTPSGSLSVLRDRGAIAALPDTALRAEGIRRLWAGYDQQRDLYAVALAGAVRAKNGLARVRGYRDAPDQFYQAASLTSDDVLALLNRVRPAAKIYKSFQRRSVQISREPRPALPASPAQRFTVNEATEVIRSALASLGSKEYARELTALLDPGNGRLDLGGGSNRAAGGGANGYAGITSSIYLESFDGSYGALSRLAHEAGHAVENQLINVHGVPAVYARGTSYLSEAYALFTELVVANALYEKAPNPRMKRFYLAQFLSNAMEVFHGAQDADLEQSIYNLVDARGGAITATDLDSLTTRVDTAYSIAGESFPAVRARWITARLLYEDPLYYFNYMYSGLLALKLFESYKRDPAAFGARYVALLSSGYCAAPVISIRQSLGIDLDDPHLLESTVALLEPLLAAYR